MIKQPSVIEFSAKGHPWPQGSKVAFVRAGRAHMVDVCNRASAKREANALKHWRERIARAASLPLNWEPWTGPILLECEFVLPRSKSHFTSKGAIRKGAPVVPQYDLDKLLRAAGDALSKVVYVDDTQITGFGASTKRFSHTLAGIGGVKIRVQELPLEDYAQRAGYRCGLCHEPGHTRQTCENEPRAQKCSECGVLMGGRASSLCLACVQPHACSSCGGMGHNTRSCLQRKSQGRGE